MRCLRMRFFKVDWHKITVIPTRFLANNNTNNSSAKSTHLLAATLLLGGCFGVTVSADVLPQNTLGGIGANQLGIRTGNAVQAVCGQFVKAAGEGNAPAAGSNAADLFDKCGEMVHNANELDQQSNANNTGPTAKSLGLNKAELQSALQNIAGEEASASGSLATEASSGQAANISKRLSALLSKSSSLQLSAVNIFGADALYTLSEDDLRQLTGGASAGEGDLLSSPWSVFVNTDLGVGEKDATAEEDSFSYDSLGVTAGADYRVNDQVVLGLAVGINSSKADFDKVDKVSGGSMDAKASSFSTYGLFYKENYFYDAILTLGKGSFEMDRKIVIGSNSAVADNDGADRTASSDTDSTQISYSVGGGTEIIKGAVTYAPFVRVQYLRVKVDDFEETGAKGLNLSVSEQTITSTTSTLGLRVSKVKNTSFGVVIPQVHVQWIHEYQDKSRDITTIYVNDPRQNELLAVSDASDPDYFSLGAGLSAVFKGGTQAFVDIRSIVGMKDFSETAVTIGARFEL
jgi:outer membrane autotransporter protein